VTVITHGCRSNLAEAEALARWAGPARTLINSCAVTETAVRDARSAARRALATGTEVWLTGCAAAVAPERFADLAVRLVAKPRFAGPATLQSRGFLAVQDGCDHRCTFCVTRLARGLSRSTAMEAAIAAARALEARGAREIVLTGIDLAAWGQDLPGRPSLAGLVRALLAALPKAVRLRLSTLDPAAVSADLIALFASERRLAPHVHLSLQSGDELVLKRMRRRHRADEVRRLVADLRAARPDLALGADIIAGFPTESTAAHANSREMAEALDIVHAHVFPFSPRAGTAAARMPPVPADLVRARAAELRADAARRRDAWLRRLIGQRLEVVSEGDTGHSAEFAPVRLPPGVPRGALVRLWARGVRDGLIDAGGEPAGAGPG
jgi:threonylcarbamoyladenosine tRNA methylthiotransferase MtaB